VSNLSAHFGVGDQLRHPHLDGSRVFVHGLSIFFFLHVCVLLCLPILFQRSVEAATLPGPQQLQEQINVFNTDGFLIGGLIDMLLQEDAPDSLRNFVEFLAPVPGKAEAVIKQSPQQGADNRPECSEPRMGDGQVHDFSYYVHAFFSLSVILLPGIIVGFFITYPYPLKTRADWLELWRDAKFFLLRG
jgi:hypothetical protein